MSSGWCARCGYGGGGHAVPVNDGESLCTDCAAVTIRELRRQRYQLAAALGYRVGNGGNPDSIPVFEELIRQVERLVKTRKRLTEVRAFLRGSY